MTTSYNSFAEFTRILQRPDNVLGRHLLSEEKRFKASRDAIVYDKKSHVSCALQHMSMELCMNASDNVVRTRESGRDPGIIEIVVTRKSYRIKNYGNAMRVDLMESHNGQTVYIPSEMFSICSSSSNYDDSKDRFLAGKNGIGAGAVNALSVKMEVDIIDTYHTTGPKHFFQRWTKPHYKSELCTDSMTPEVVRRIAQTIAEPPTVEECDAEKSHVQVTFWPAFARFGVDCYNDEWISMLRFDAIMLSYCAGVEVTFNGESINHSKGSLGICRMLGSSEPETKGYALSSYRKEVKVDEKTGIKTIITHESKWNVRHIPVLPATLSFVNCTPTRSGGKHISELTSCIVNALLIELENEIHKDDPEARKKLIQMHVKKLNFLVKIVCSKPAFDGPTKDRFSGDVGDLAIPPEFIDGLPCKERIRSSYKATLMLDANKKLTAPKGQRPKKPKNLEDSNTTMRKQNDDRNTLTVTEGNSAVSYMKQGANEPEYNGYLPLRGKCRNITNIDIPSIMKSESIVTLINAFGFRFGDDFSEPILQKSARYCRLRIATDQDPDGWHIQALIVNLIATYWPGLIQSGRVTIVNSPIVRCVNKKTRKVIKFYSYSRFEEWQEGQSSGWIVKYSKGLGSNEPEDIVDDFADGINELVLQWDDDAMKSLSMAFSNKEIPSRKRVLTKYDPENEAEFEESMTISELIYTRWRMYSLYNIKRGIIRFADGLKPSETKIYYCILKEYRKSKTSSESNTAKVGVNSLAGRVIEQANYHHGEVSLYETITKMARGFPGASNLPLLYPAGSFGSRDENGKDHSAARYIKTCPRPLMEYLFRREDDPILTYEVDDSTGKTYEPEFYLPVIPFQLVKNELGMATGWSTVIPPHDVDDVIVAVSQVVCGEKMDTITPKYRYYMGKIETNLKGVDSDEAIEIKSEENDEDGTDSDILLSTRRSPHIVAHALRRIYKENGVYWIEIRDLPPGLQFKQVKDEYDKMSTEYGGDVIDYYQMKSNSGFKFECLIKTTAEFTERINKKEIGLNEVEKKFFLRNSVTLNNMYMLDAATGMPRKYETAEEIITSFVDFRLPWYDKRREWMVADLTKKSESLRQQIKMVKLIFSGKLSLHNGVKGKSIKELTPLLASHGIDIGMVNTSTIVHTDDVLDVDEEKLARYDAQIEEIARKSSREMMMDDLTELRDAHSQYYSQITVDQKLDEYMLKKKKAKGAKK